MKKINFKSVSLFIATVGLLVFFHFTGLAKPLERGICFIFNPVGAKLQNWGSGISAFYKDHFGRENLASKEKSLEEKVETLTVENASLKQDQEENIKLRSYLNFFKDEKNKYVLADVIAKNVSGEIKDGSDILMINKGKKDNLKSDLAVLNEQGVVVGKTYNCEDNTCQLALITGNSCQLAISLLNQSGTSGITSGNMGLTVSLNFIPQSENISVGDLVVTSGMEDNIPRGLTVGKVSLIDKGSNEIWQKASLEPLFDLEDLTIVSVLIP